MSVATQNDQNQCALEAATLSNLSTTYMSTHASNVHFLPITTVQPIDGFVLKIIQCRDGSKIRNDFSQQRLTYFNTNA